ncbi:DNA-directed RNA polymerase subunit alpha [Candidatus Dojkabacteria bacterium]|nr:DNA-directed RNA polymerase subunit alpha [Candidatus Dojkabacteria bacterium]
MVSLNQFTIKKSAAKGNTATFEIGPLPKGYGSTMAVYLRRILLSSIPGSAITAVKIDGVQHEYSTLSGVADDILAVILSLKNVVLVSKTLEPVVLEIDVKGKEGEVVEVKAGDIEKSAEVEIINPEYVITKLTSGKSRFKAQLTVKRGVGFAVGDEAARKELGMLPVDANFSPVKLVNYTISQARVGQETELDQLNLTMETNGAVSPVEALHVATDILNQATSHLTKLTEQMLAGNEVTVALNQKQKIAQTVNAQNVAKPELKVSDLNLSTRLTNALVKSGYDDLNKLEGLTEEELSNIRGMGSKSFTELLDILKKHSIKLV